MLNVEALLSRWSMVLEVLAARESESDEEVQQNQKARDLFKRALDLLGAGARKPTLVLAGGFSVGKSRVLNSLLGKSLAPTAVEPTTARPTRFTFGQELSYGFMYGTGKVQNVTAEEFEQLQHNADSFNKVNQSEKVVSAIVEAPARLLEFVDLLDTPGINSVSWQSSETSDAQRTATVLQDRNAHVVVWVMNASKGGVQDWEIEHVRELREAGKFCIGLINQADLVSPSNRKTILNKVRESVLFDEVFLYSAEIREDRDNHRGDLNILPESADLKLDWESDALIQCLYHQRVALQPREIREVYYSMREHLDRRVDSWTSQLNKAQNNLDKAKLVVREMMSDIHNACGTIYQGIVESRAIEYGLKLGRVIEKSKKRGNFSAEVVLNRTFVPMMNEFVTEFVGQFQSYWDSCSPAFWIRLPKCQSDETHVLLHMVVSMFTSHMINMNDRAVLLSEFIFLADGKHLDHEAIVRDLAGQSLFGSTFNLFIYGSVDRDQYPASDDQVGVIGSILLDRISEMDEEVLRFDYLHKKLLCIKREMHDLND